MNKILQDRLKKIDIDLNNRQLQQLDEYFRLLVEWNKVMNLTAITEYEEVIEKHFVDSLSIVKAIDKNMYRRVMDIGTGAGFPGIPLKIAFPDMELVLLDSLKKRIGFLDTVIAQLKLTNIMTLHGRAEDFARQKEYREQFDLCVSRAVANLSTLSEYCIPFVKKNGFFISYKSGNVDEEVENSQKAVKLLGGSLKEVIRFSLPDSDIQRTFVKISKVDATPKKYPRKAGLPSREPL